MEPAEELHLSPVTGAVQMRPQFHHIDAQAQIAKAKLARERAANESTRANEPRIVQQTARIAADDEELNVANTAKLLTAAAEESWLRLQIHSEEVSLPKTRLSVYLPLTKDAPSYDAYYDKMFVHDTESAAQLKYPWNSETYLNKMTESQDDFGDSSTKRKRKTPKKEIVEIVDEAEEDQPESPPASRQKGKRKAPVRSQDKGKSRA
jgi:DNA-directed RNA polymerase-3 subunit RPC5